MKDLSSISTKYHIASDHSSRKEHATIKFFKNYLDAMVTLVDDIIIEFEK